jgi:hypothetical protein
MKTNLSAAGTVLLCISFIFISCFGAFSQATYYVASNGSDRNDGRSEMAPWKTIKQLLPGNTYLLKRGDMFYFPVKHIDNDLITGDKIVIAAYGKGKKPMISLYKRITPGAWLSAGINVWKVDLKDTANYAGYLDNTDTNVGFLKVANQIKGNKLDSLNALKTDWDFYSDNKYLYVHLKKNPATVSNKIQITVNTPIISLSNNMEVHDLWLEGTGGHGIQGVYAANVILKNLDINETGGSFLAITPNGGLRYGNGIEFWAGASDCLVEGCTVQNVYDAAFTIQSNYQNSHFTNVVFNHNMANNNEQSFEFWVATPESSFVNCAFINNDCKNAGFGWSHSVRPFKNSGVHLLCFFWNPKMTGLTISENKFVGAKSGYYYLPKNLPVSGSFKSVNNKIALAPNALLRADNAFSYKVNDYKQFIQAFDLEKGSVFTELK